jgi:DNA polymerase sigma
MGYQVLKVMLQSLKAYKKYLFFNRKRKNYFIENQKKLPDILKEQNLSDKDSSKIHSVTNLSMISQEIAEYATSKLHEIHSDLEADLISRDASPSLKEITPENKEIQSRKLRCETIEKFMQEIFESKKIELKTVGKCTKKLCF